MNKVIIAIDGQASTGKSTQAKKIADNLGFNYRDSGAYYRAITLYLLNNNLKHNLKISQEILNQIIIFPTTFQHQLQPYIQSQPL